MCMKITPLAIPAAFWCLTCPPPIQWGEATRIFNNIIVGNNEPNFAPEGNIVGEVPAGVGLMIMANDDIEAFGDTITDNNSIGVLIVSYYFIDPKVDAPENHDPMPEKIYLHDNTMRGAALTHKIWPGSFQPLSLVAKRSIFSMTVQT